MTQQHQHEERGTQAAHPTASPTTVATAIVNAATSGVVTSPGSGSPNKLLYNRLPQLIASLRPSPAVSRGDADVRARAEMGDTRR